MACRIVEKCKSLFKADRFRKKKNLLDLIVNQTMLLDVRRITSLIANYYYLFRMQGERERERIRNLQKKKKQFPRGKFWVIPIMKVIISFFFAIWKRTIEQHSKAYIGYRGKCERKWKNSICNLFSSFAFQFPTVSLYRCCCYIESSENIPLLFLLFCFVFLPFIFFYFVRSFFFSPRWVLLSEMKTKKILVAKRYVRCYWRIYHLLESVWFTFLIRFQNLKITYLSISLCLWLQHDGAAD